jgi:hypothetical protein
MLTTHTVCGMQVCCESRLQAALKGHCDCFIGLAPDQQYEGPWDVYPCVRIVLHKGDMGFIQQLFMNHHWIALAFGKMCIIKRDSDSLQVAVAQAVGVDLSDLVDRAIRHDRDVCLSVLLGFGAPLQGEDLLTAATWNSLKCLDLVLAPPHGLPLLDPPSCPKLQSQAALAGNVRFLMRIFDAGWPMWDRPIDGDRWMLGDKRWLGFFRRVIGNLSFPNPFDKRNLVVSSSNLYCSGPVLLYAAQLGVELTPTMNGLLRDVRSRALALAGCFHRAAAIRKVPGPIDREVDAMGQVPTDLIKSIATLARISIVDQKFIE